jgi:hypothetical protein
MSLLTRLNERKLAEWALAYLAGAWLVLQLLDVLAGVWPVSLEFQRGVHTVVALGFPVALIMAWHHGMPGNQGVSKIEILLIAGLCAIAAASVAALGQEASEASWVVPVLSVLAMAALPASAALAWKAAHPQTQSPEAVLSPDELSELRRSLLAAKTPEEVDRVRMRVLMMLASHPHSSELQQLWNQLPETEVSGRFDEFAGPYVSMEALPRSVGALGSRLLSIRPVRLLGIWLLGSFLAVQLTDVMWSAWSYPSISLRAIAFILWNLFYFVTIVLIWFRRRRHFGTSALSGG